MLQELIDEALIKAYMDYEKWQGFDDCAVAILPNGQRAAVKLWQHRDTGLRTTVEYALQTIQQANGRSGFGLVYRKVSERELLFLFAINDTEKGICALELKRETTNPVNDLVPIPEMSHDPDCSRIASFEWGATRRRVPVEARDYITI